MKLLRNSLLGLSTLPVLLACDPAFETTEQLCQGALATRQAVQSYHIKLFETNDDGNFETDEDGNKVRKTDYPLYVENFLNSFKNIQSKAENGDLSPPSSEEQAVIDFIFEQVSKDMNYTLDEEGTVVAANNPLDFMESLIAAIDTSKLVQTFVEAKKHVATAISKDDGHCNYSNDQIEFIREDEALNIVDAFDASLDLSYIPSAFVEEDNKVDQTVVIAFDQDPESDSDNELQFAALDRIAPENFKASGFSEAKVRQIRVIQTEPPEIFSLDEDYQDTKLGTMGYAVLNQTCLDEAEENTVTCPEGSITKDIEHPACYDGIDEDEDSLTNHDVADERNTIIKHSFSIGDGDSEALNELQRLKVEVDYPNNEIRVYVSKFSTAIYKALDEDGNAIPQGSDNPNPSQDELILNPTNCEAYNVSKDLYELQSDEDASIPATDYEDPGYEYIAKTDENGDTVLDEDDNVVYISPTPLFTFQGTVISERQ